MDIEAKKASLYKQYLENLNALQYAEDLDDMVHFVHGTSIFMKSAPTYKEHKKILTKAKKLLNLKLSFYHYYMNGDDLAMKYSFLDKSEAQYYIIFFCQDAEVALGYYSKGKCRIEERTTTELVTVCDIGA